VILLLGNKTDEDSPFESQILETEQRIKEENLDKCCQDPETCKHIIFSSCSLFTQTNVAESIELLTLALLELTPNIMAERLQSVINRNSRAPSDFDSSMFQPPLSIHD